MAIHPVTSTLHASLGAHRAVVCLLLAALCGGLVAGCRTAPPAGRAAAPERALEWPAAGSAPARVRWVAEIRSPADLGIRPGFFRRLLNWLAGNEAPRLVRPHGVAVDPSGRLWVADPGARRVHIFDEARGRYQTLPLKGDPPLHTPIAVTHDPQGVAYVSDSSRRVIRRFDAKGRSLAEWDGFGEFARPTGLAFDPATGLLWVVDTGSHRLLALDGRGRIRRFLGERGDQPGRFNFPTHVAIDPRGRLFVVDTLNFRVQILSTDGEPLGAFGAPGDGPGFLSKPKGIALDRDGHVYVADSLFDNVQIFDEDGRVLLYFGDRGTGAGEFWTPAGVDIAGGTRIYVADAYNQRIQVFDYLGE